MNRTIKSNSPNAIRSRRWRDAHPGENAKKTAAWRKANRETSRALCRTAYRKKAKLPEPTRPVPDVCDCCGGPSGKRHFHLDHDHETGKFRGWLCGGCNTAIGRLGDNVAGILRALTYLLNNT